MPGAGVGVKPVLLYRCLTSTDLTLMKKHVGFLQCTMFSQCQLTLQIGVEESIILKKKANRDKNSIFILISLTEG